MKAVCLQSKTPKDLALIDTATPDPEPGQVRVKVEAVGICGSDVSAALAKPNFDFVSRPRVLGHEFSGTIDSLGEGVSGWQPGARVCALAVHSCHRCSNCRNGNTQICRERQILGFHKPGAMAEYVCVDARYVMPLNPKLTFVDGALIEPLSVASRAVLKMTDIKPGDDVIVSGPGIIGMLCAFLAKARGGNVSLVGIELDEPIRLKKARELGFHTYTVTDQSPLAAQLERPADCLIEASGAPGALAAAGDSVRWGGHIMVIATYGTPVDWTFTGVVRAEQKIHTCMASAWDDFAKAQRHLEDGIIPVNELVELYNLDDALTAFEASFNKTTPKAVMTQG